MVLFNYYVVLTFEPVDEMLWCGHSNETSSTIHMVLVVQYVVVTTLLVMKWLMTKHFSIKNQQFHTCFSSVFAFLSALLLFCLLGVAGTIN